MLLAIDPEGSSPGVAMMIGLLLCFSVVFLLGIPLVRALRGPRSRRPRLYGQGRRPNGRS